jgi:predicted dehydrogenase
VASAAQFRRSTGGGGVLIDKGIHALDTLCHIFGPGRLVRSADDAPRGHGVESNMVLDLSFGATRGLMQVSWEAPLNNGFQVAGQEEELWMPISPIDAVWIRRLSAGAVLPWSRREAIPTWPSDLSSGRFSPKNIFDCIRLELVSMLRAIHMGEPLVADGAEGLSVMRLLVEAYERAAPLRQPWLPEAERRSVAARHWRSNGHAASPSSPASEAAPSLTTFASRAH